MLKRNNQLALGCYCLVALCGFGLPQALGDCWTGQEGGATVRQEGGSPGKTSSDPQEKRRQERPKGVEENGLPAKEKFHQFLLMGQSNMAGRGVVESRDVETHPRIWMLDKENRWVAAKSPLHFDKPIAGTGMGLEFARSIVDNHPEVSIGLIPSAVGGTPLSRWMPDGDLYQQAVARGREAQKLGSIRGFLWHQGESDAGDEKLANSYAERLAKMIMQLRKDLDCPNAPFIAGELGHFLEEKNKEGKPSHWKVVNQQLQSLPSRVENVFVVDSKELQHKGDGVHFDAPSLREFGRRYANAYLRMAGRE